MQNLFVVICVFLAFVSIASENCEECTKQIDDAITKFIEHLKETKQIPVRFNMLGICECTILGLDTMKRSNNTEVCKETFLNGTKNNINVTLTNPARICICKVPSSAQGFAGKVQKFVNDTAKSVTCPTVQPATLDTPPKPVAAALKDIDLFLRNCTPKINPLDATNAPTLLNAEFNITTSVSIATIRFTVVNSTLTKQVVATDVQFTLDPTSTKTVCTEKNKAVKKYCQCFVNFFSFFNAIENIVQAKILPCENYDNFACK